MVNNTDLRDIVKGTPKGAEAIQSALVGAARDQEDIRTQSELDEILDGLVLNARSIEMGDISMNQLWAEQREAKQAILDWHNRRVEKLLSNPQPTYARSLKNLGEFLERYNLDIGLAEDKENLKKWSDAIQAERNKLNEGK